MDWVHCNMCYVQPGGPENHRFVITSCGHTYCTLCAAKVPREKCQVCQASFETTDLCSEMKGDVYKYFQEPIELFSEALKVATFQQGHRSRFVSRLRASHMKYNGLKAEAMKLARENHNMLKKLKHTELELGWYKTQLRSAKQKLNESNRLSSHLENAETPTTPSQFRRPSTPSSTPARSFFDINSQQPPSSSSFFNPRFSNPAYSSGTSVSTPSSTINGISPPYSSQRSSGYSSRGLSTPMSAGERRPSNSMRSGQSQSDTPEEFSTPSLLRKMNFSDRLNTPNSKRL